jgi:hypothetical protein
MDSCVFAFEHAGSGARVGLPAVEKFLEYPAAARGQRQGVVAAAGRAVVPPDPHQGAGAELTQPVGTPPA